MNRDLCFSLCLFSFSLCLFSFSQQSPEPPKRSNLNGRKQPRGEDAAPPRPAPPHASGGGALGRGPCSQVTPSPDPRSLRAEGVPRPDRKEGMGRRERYLVIRCLPRTQTQLPRAEPHVTVGVDLQERARGGGVGRDLECTSPTQETSGGTEAGSGAGGMTRAQPSRWALWCDIFLPPLGARFTSLSGPKLHPRPDGATDHHKGHFPSPSARGWRPWLPPFQRLTIPRVRGQGRRWKRTNTELKVQEQRHVVRVHKIK